MEFFRRLSGATVPFTSQKTPLFPADRIWETNLGIEAEFPNSVGPKGWTHEMAILRGNSFFGTLAC